MRFTTTLILLVVTCVLALAYGIVLQREPGNSRGEIFPAAFDPAAFDALVIRRGDSTLELSRSGPSSWTLRQPVEIAADPQRVHALLSALAQMPRSAFRLADVKPQTYRLDRPAAVLSMRQGDHTWLLRIGQAIPMSSSVAAQTREDGPVFSVPEDVATALQQPLEDYAFRQLLPFVPERLTRITVAAPTFPLTESPYRLVRADDRYALEMPGRVRTDQANASALVRRLHEMEIEKFADRAIDPVSMGFDQPMLRIEIAQSEGAAPLILTVGKPSPEHKNLVFARRDDLNVALLVDSAAIDRLIVPPQDLRDMQLLDAAKDEIGALSLQAGEAMLDLKRSGESWRIQRAGGESIETDFDAIDHLLDALTVMRVSGVAAEQNPPADRFGFEKPLFRLAVGFVPAGGATRPAVELTVGSKAPIDPKEIYVRRSDEPQVYVVDKTLMDFLSTSPLPYRSRTFFTCNPAAISSVTRTTSTGALALAKGADGWRFVESANRLDPFRVDGLVGQLAHIRVSMYVTDDPAASLDSFGLKSPETVLAFTEEPATARPGERAVTHTLAIGKPMKDAFRYARFGDSPTIFVLDGETVDNLTQDVKRK